VLFCTRADAVSEAYRRYLVNALRESFDLPGVPVRLTLREKANPYAGNYGDSALNCGNYGASNWAP
jgi:predicted GTPase